MSTSHNCVFGLLSKFKHICHTVIVLCHTVTVLLEH